MPPPTSRQIDAGGLATPDALLDAIRSLEPEPTGIYLHLDLDVLDADVAGVNVYQRAGRASTASSSPS